MKAHAFAAKPITAIATAVFLLPTVTSAQPTAAPGSLKGKSNAELVQLITGSTKPLVEKPQPQYDEDRVAPSPIDVLWEMDPRDAAVAFASQYIGQEARPLELHIAEREAKPPASGEIGLRWISGNKYAPRTEGVTILKHDGYTSELLLSEVEIEGRPSKEEIEAAVMKMDSHPLPRLVAQQTYEILWWLRHVRPVKPMNSWSSGSSTSNDDFGGFWMRPDGPVLEKTVISEPCGDCIAQGDGRSYQGFAATLLRRLAARSGIKRRYPVPKVGIHFCPDDDAKFLHERPPDRTNAKAVRSWVGRLVEILRKPERQHLHSDVMDMLVPITDPLRYPDERIDDALLDVLHRGREAAANFKEVEPEYPEFDPNEDEETAKKREAEYEAKRDELRKERWRISELRMNADAAAEKLGAHDAISSFPELLKLASLPPDESFSRNTALIGAAAIVGRHPKLRSGLLDHLKPKLESMSGNEVLDFVNVDAVWRADLRELSPQLERLASMPVPPDLKNPHWRVAHAAGAVLVAWRETDPLTKTKLDALLTGEIGRGSYLPEFLRKEFAALSAADQFAFRQFITWMRTVDVDFSRRYLEDIFTPHTPRPDVFLER